MNRPLDKRFLPGYTLNEADWKDLLFQVDRRDKWIEKYQQMELDKSRELQQKNAYILDLLSRVRVPLTGYALQEGTSTGLYADGWVAGKARFTVRPLKPVTKLSVRGWRPDHAASAEITLNINDRPALTTKIDHGSFEIRVVLDQPLEAPFGVEINCHPLLEPLADDRSLAFVLIEVRAEHL